MEGLRTGDRPRAMVRGRRAREDVEPGRRRPPPRGRRRLKGGRACLVLAAMTLMGCDGLGQPEREEAHARLTADRDAAVRILTSTTFNVITLEGPDGVPQVELIASDTVVQPPPWEETFDIADTRRFFIQVTAVDTGSIHGRLEVFIDGERRANLTADLQEQPLTNLFLQQR